MPCSNKHSWSDPRGFTLAEIIVTVILVSMLASLALAKYRDSVGTHTESQGIANLRLLHTANLIYKADTGGYWNPKGNPSLSTINSSLGTQIPDDSEFSYKYQTSGGGSKFKFTAEPNGYSFKLEADDDPLSSSNPCCSHGTCPSLSGC